MEPAFGNIIQESQLGRSLHSTIDLNLFKWFVARRTGIRHERNQDESVTWVQVQAKQNYDRNWSSRADQWTQSPAFKHVHCRRRSVGEWTLNYLKCWNNMTLTEIKTWHTHVLRDWRESECGTMTHAVYCNPTEYVTLRKHVSNLNDNHARQSGRINR